MATSTPATVYLFRHGRVIPERHDELSREGLLFRDALPEIFRDLKVNLQAVFFDASAERCQATVARLGSPQFGYAPARELRTLNAVLSTLTSGAHAICCRGDSIESGQLYHVRDFALHVPFGVPRYAEVAREALRDSYHVVYCLRSDGHQWSYEWSRRGSAQAAPGAA